MRLAEGHHLYEFPDGSWRVLGPGDAFLRVTGPSEAVARLRERLCGPPPRKAEPARLVTDGDERSDAVVGQLADALRERGVIVDADSSARARPGPSVLHVAGDGPVARLVADLAAGWATRVRRGPVDETVVRGADVLVDCAGWLPDTDWRRVERWCGQHATAWTRAHMEGLSLFAGPLTVPGRSAGYEDVRGRRLAAAGAPEELLAHWSWLGASTSEPPPVPWPGRGVVAVAAGLLLGEVERWWATDQLPEIDVQVEVGPDGEMRRHPVLPLPVVASPAAPRRGARPAGPVRT
ncbi:hypothetical protein Ga0074812_103396 [Parafrankia irregularis]|uniref:Uncharacterized protein n=1 Tax=Parafrankia irregularis TaxID=795642 RepID=A0A0S4QK42_9ACTN|nr:MULTISPECIES: hypothetical protein [Parafrankia]MBE3200710.1 hypothetical protein [Parafrankia sp. CH37]CUU54906.1 hypothetical protein Ga0074812_103396 [Parafrankia irregularis]